MASLALQQAQSRLLTLRSQLKASRGDDLCGSRSAGGNSSYVGLLGAGSTLEAVERVQRPDHDLLNAQKTLALYRRRDGVGVDHADGAHSSQKQAKPVAVEPVQQPAPHVSQQVVDQLHQINLVGQTIKHYPTLGVAALEMDQSSFYRTWLMFRYLDQNGRGWLPVGQVRDVLASAGSPLQMFSWRRMRQLLGQGHGRFWDWDKQQGRVWLYGAAKIAASLEVVRLSGHPVALPVTVVTAGIGEFRAHLYGAWHSGRKHSNPITRQEQEAMTGVPARTQRAYCVTANVARKRNIAIGEKCTEEALKLNAWRHGQVFEFVDHLGQQGTAGRRYVAWQMPNSYTGTHQKATKGRMKKINRKLKDLVTLGAQGNSGERIEKLYHANGSEAGRAFNRSTDVDAYWPVHQAGRGSQAVLWSVFFVK